MRIWSASQCETLLSCQRKWYFKYIRGFKEPRSANLLFGSTFHAAIEDHILDREDTTKKTLIELASMDDHPWESQLQVMLQSYWEAQTWKEVLTEVDFTDEFYGVRGIFDGFSEDGFIIERKTTGMPFKNLTEVLPRLQLGLYIGLSPVANDVRGFRYVETKKPTERRRKNESNEAFGNRMTCSTQVIEHVLTEKQKKALYERSIRIVDYCEKLSKTAQETPEGNPGACHSFGQKCHFFGLCHGDIFDGISIPDELPSS